MFELKFKVGDKVVRDPDVWRKVVNNMEDVDMTTSYDVLAVFDDGYMLTSQNGNRRICSYWMLSKNAIVHSILKDL